MQLTISRKVYFFCGFCVVAGLVTTAYLLHRLSITNEEATAFTVAESRELNDARLVQVTFKKQVQSWKDILLRGHDPQNLQKYREEFFKEEADVKNYSSNLQKKLTSDENRNLLKKFVDAHQDLGSEYRSALAAFEASKGAQYKRADQALRGKDREPTDLVDQLVEKINENAGILSDQRARDLARDRNVLLVVACVFWGLILVGGILIARGIVRPLADATSVISIIARGDFTLRVDDKSHDEIGDMARALNGMLQNLNASLAAIGERSAALASSSEELSAVSQQMSANAEETATQSTVVSAAAEQVTKNLQTVATATEEMSSSIKEIAKNSNEAARVATSAVNTAETTNASVAKLGESSAEIGQVIKVITSIAQQTNLLALNATIEAARAGEAGKGFAVVANEVKELAKETAKATEDISRKIEAIQTDTKGAVEAIGEISGVIHQINDISSTIASAVEEQTATTNEIARNVQEGARGGSQVAENIVAVAQAAKSTTQGAGDTQTAAGELARMAGELQKIIAQYKFEGGGSGAMTTEFHSAAEQTRAAHLAAQARTQPLATTRVQ